MGLRCLKLLRLLQCKTKENIKMEYIKKIVHAPSEDRNSCALNATSIALDVPYYDVYKVYKAFGRVHGR